MLHPQSQTEQLKKQFGFSEFRGPQQSLIERCLLAKSTLALMPTGAGKSLIYQYVASLCENNEIVLVISPLIALMQDQAQKAQSFGISATYINSALSAEQKQNRMREVSEGKYQLLFVAPERFQKAEFWSCIKQRQLVLFVVDEAHCISLWGHDFRPEYSQLQNHRKSLGMPPVLALTATATADVQGDILRQFGLTQPDELVLGGIERPNLSLNFVDCYGSEEKNEKLFELLKEKSGQSGIVYFSLIQTLESFSAFLNSKKMTYRKYHGDLPSDMRRKNQKDFIGGACSLILATPAFGLGIDKPDIRYVVHYEIPSSIEAYFQEVGRAGRDGEEALGLFLYDEDDLTIQMQFLNWAYPEAAFIEKVYDLISSKSDVVSIQGFEYLREQMVFKNKKDFRVNAAVSILSRWGCLEEVETPFGYSTVRAPTQADFDLEDQNLLKKEHQKKLLALLRLIQNRDVCRLQQVYTYFAHIQPETCGICDVCRG